MVGSGDGLIWWLWGFYDGVVDYAVVSGCGRKTAWCVDEVAIDQIANPAELSVFNTPGSSQTPKNAYFPLFANKIRNATMKSSHKQ